MGAAVRLGLLRTPFLWPDEATIARMGLVVLRGEFPVYFHGQPFMGALDAYLLAPLYVTVGASALAAELLPVLLMVAWLALVARFAWVAFGPRPALFTAVLMALPPNLLLFWSHEVRPQYLWTLVFGTLALMLAHGLRTASPSRATRSVALIGALLGLGLWTNFLSLVYVGPVAVLAVPAALRRRVWPALLAGLPAFALGSLPHWVYGLQHGTALPPSGGAIRLADVAGHVRVFARVSWPALAGVPAWWRETLLGTALALLLAAVYAAAVAAAVRRAARGPDRGAAAANVALLVLVAVNVGVAVSTRYGRFLTDPDQRFFLPLYSALPLLAGQWLAGLPWRRAAALTAALLLLHGTDGAAAADVRVVSAFRSLPAPVVAMREGQPATLAALAAEGPRRLYADDPWTRALTFLSRERLVFSDPYQEIYPPSALAVDGAETVGWWMSGRSPVFEANLAALGLRFGYRPAGPLGGSYVDFAMPAEGLHELDPDLFTVAASENAPAAAWMLDRDAATLWRTAGPKRGGEWIQVDLGRVERVALVRWLPGTFQEVPGGLALDLSLDGHAWQRVIELPSYIGPLYVSAGRPLGRVRGGRVELRVPPTRARHLRITQIGRHAVWPWTVRELFVYARGEEPPSSGLPDATTLASTIRAAGVTRLYADHGWGSRVALADPAIRVVPANRALDPYGFEGSSAEFLPRFDWAPGSAALLEPADAEGVTRTARGSGLGVTRRSLGGLVLFTYAPPVLASGTPIAATALRVTASRQPERAGLAADGDRRTRWATARPQVAGDWLRVDLATPRALRAIRLWTAYPTDAPRGVRLEGSDDGTTWRAIAAGMRTEGRLRFGGIALLRDGVEAVRLDFEPQALRALRVTLSRGDPVFDWSVHELAVYGAD